MSPRWGKRVSWGNVMGHGAWVSGKGWRRLLGGDRTSERLSCQMADGVGWEDVFPQADLVGLCPGSDHAKRVLRVWNFLSTKIPWSTFWLHGTCKQHATGLCLAPATVFFIFYASYSAQ